MKLILLGYTIIIIIIIIIIVIINNNDINDKDDSNYNQLYLRYTINHKNNKSNHVTFINLNDILDELLHFMRIFIYISMFYLYIRMFFLYISMFFLYIRMFFLYISMFFFYISMFFLYFRMFFFFLYYSTYCTLPFLVPNINAGVLKPLSLTYLI